MGSLGEINTLDQKSGAGFMVYIRDSLVSWMSRKQNSFSPVNYRSGVQGSDDGHTRDGIHSSDTVRAWSGGTEANVDSLGQPGSHVRSSQRNQLCIAS